MCPNNGTISRRGESHTVCVLCCIWTAWSAEQRSRLVSTSICSDLTSCSRNIWREPYVCVCVCYQSHTEHCENTHRTLCVCVCVWEREQHAHLSSAVLCDHYCDSWTAEESWFTCSIFRAHEAPNVNRVCICVCVCVCVGDYSFPGRNYTILLAHADPDHFFTLIWKSLTVKDSSRFLKHIVSIFVSLNLLC